MTFFPSPLLSTCHASCDLGPRLGSGLFGSIVWWRFGCYRQAGYLPPTRRISKGSGKDFILGFLWDFDLRSIIRSNELVSWAHKRKHGSYLQPSSILRFISCLTHTHTLRRRTHASLLTHITTADSPSSARSALTARGHVYVNHSDEA